jgi:hypothetical protein
MGVRSSLELPHFEVMMERKRDTVKTWKMKNGNIVELAKMSDCHLANAIKMVARNCHTVRYLGEMTDDTSFKKLVGEGQKRRFRITILNTPIEIDGRKEYVEVWTPHSFPQSKISSSIIPTDWDSRPQE